MAKYRKTALVEAEQYHGPEFETLAANLPLVAPAGVKFYEVRSDTDGRKGWAPAVETLEGRHFLRTGDWIITNPAGERYNCADAVFRATYEPVDAHAEPVPSVELGEPRACPTCKRPPPGFEYVGAVASKS